MKYMQALLRFIERYTKTDIRYLAKGGFWLSIDEIVGAVTVFLLAIAFANYVPKDAYGTYRYLLATFWMLTAFTMTGLPTAVSRAVARGREGVFRESVSWSIAWSLPISGIALACGAYYFIHAQTLLAYGFILIAVFGPFIQAAYLFSAYLVGKKQFKVLSFCGALFSLIPAIVLFIAMRVNPDPLSLLFAYLASVVATGLGIAVFLVLRFSPNRETDSEYKKLGGHFSAMNLLSTVAGQVDKLLVFHYLGAIDLAVYTFATAFPDQIKNLFGSISTLALPKFVERSFTEIRANFWNRLWAYTAVLTVIALAYIALAPIFFDWFFPAYTDAIYYSRWYALALIPTGAALPIALLQAHKAHQELYAINVITPIVQIIALVLLTSHYGLLGAIFARVIGRVWAFLVAGALVEVHARRIN